MHSEEYVQEDDEEYVQEDDEETDDETVHEITDAVKADAEKAEEVMNDTKKV
ncbi:hypothetical protein Tco_0602752, partial [Tanacetum coccineum]